MLRSILRNQQLRKGIKSNHSFLTASVNLKTKLNETRQFSSTDQKATDLKHLKIKSTNLESNQFIQHVIDCRRIEDLFNLIRPKLNSLNSNELESVFIAINELIFRTQFDSIRSSVRFKQYIRSSELFNLLLDRSINQIKHLNSNCLVKLFRTLDLLNYEIENRIVRELIEELNKRSNELNVNEILNCLKIVAYYLRSDANYELWNLNKNLIELAKSKLLTNQFDLTDINLIKIAFFIFLNPENDPNQLLINHLTEHLLSSTNQQLNFRQSIDLLKTIKKNHIFIKNYLSNNLISEIFELKYEQKDFYPKSMINLIDQCNSVIFDTFSSGPHSNELIHYLFNLHFNIDAINYEFDHFYDERFLQFLVPFLLNEFKHSNLNFKTKDLIFNLNANYRKFNVFDERLLKLIYELVCTDKKLRSNSNSYNTYSIFSKHRFPFVDHQQLATKLLFDTSQTNCLLNDTKNNLLFLSQLILNDVNDEKLINRLDDLTTNLTKTDFELVSKSEFTEIKLASVYLSMFSKMNSNLKLRIASKLERVVDKLKELKKTYLIGDIYFKINNKLQLNGYLSNGLIINTFAIYNRSTNDLLPLNDYLDYFDRVDQICDKLNENEELITFLVKYRLKGYISNYEKTSNYQFKKVLNYYNIKTIEVFKDDFSKLNIEDQVQFFINKIVK